KSSLVKQSTALLETEGLKLEFSPEALAEIANFAFRVNESTENIGARRLHTIMERVLDEISFDAPDLAKQTSGKQPEDANTSLAFAASAELGGATNNQASKPSPTIPLVERASSEGT